MKYPYITINVEYNPNDREEGMEFDYVLAKIAKRYEGEQTGSGFMVSTGTRDQNFAFSNLKQARKFVFAVKRFNGVLNVNSHCVLYNNDY